MAATSLMAMEVSAVWMVLMVVVVVVVVVVVTMEVSAVRVVMVVAMEVSAVWMVVVVVVVTGSEIERGTGVERARVGGGGEVGRWLGEVMVVVAMVGRVAGRREGGGELGGWGWV